jgi:broad specificity phosphatase PhoE
VTSDNITWLSSPFLRCLETSNEALNAFQKVQGDVHRLEIKPEYSVFEWDGHGGTWHASLPPMEERAHYFPRLNPSHESLFVPTLPEPRSDFHNRCDRAVKSMGKRYPYSPRSALVVVTHAAGCIGMVMAATNLTSQEITPAGPCSVFHLTRTSDTDLWSLDPHDASLGMNGHTDHISNVGGKTNPWNNFGDKKVNRGYTGPPKSRFAPPEVRDEL